ncbi:hypothetical protein FAES_0241 [Fibrella aestuarina BUZ 2]|uniref:Uncharacterized protein n=1 Tax=Fibrella aestuarina BUZ 2 TaxID=1166018 RepID=I0K2A2_9BACT|nr:hypothetical protein FAES_0241 [Fibrella aestuarina BUZ 2]
MSFMVIDWFLSKSTLRMLLNNAQLMTINDYK